MAIAITLMVPFYQIDVLAPFSAAFTKIPGWGWCQYLVSVGAVFGIGTVLLVRGTPWGSCTCTLSWMGGAGFTRPCA